MRRPVIPTITSSQRSVQPFLLPHISMGAQRYNIESSLGKRDRGLAFNKYQPRVFDYTTPVPGPGSYEPHEIKSKSFREPPEEETFEAFRELSYIQKSDSVGKWYDYSKPGVNNVVHRFPESSRFKDPPSEAPGVGKYHINEDVNVSHSAPPRFTVPKHEPKKLSSYQIRKRFWERTPCGADYDSQSSLKRAVWSEKQIRIPKSDRIIHPKQDTPGPGHYEINLSSEKNKKNKQDLQNLNVSFSSQSQFITPGPGAYKYEIKNKKTVKFQQSRRKYEFLDPYGLRKQNVPGPGSYKPETPKLERKQASFPKQPKPPVFQVKDTPNPGQYWTYFSSFDPKPKPQPKSYIDIKKLNSEKIAQMALMMLEFEEI